MKLNYYEILFTIMKTISYQSNFEMFKIEKANYKKR